MLIWLKEILGELYTDEIDSSISKKIGENFVINEILKSYSNERLEYDFNVFYYNGKDKKRKKETVKKSRLTVRLI